MLHKQPLMYDRLRVWRKGEPLLDGAPMWAKPGEWGSILWTDGERSIAPDILDEWELTAAAEDGES